MNIELKSICYAFVANNIEIYIPDDEGFNNIFIASCLTCGECGHKWYPNLQECYFCGQFHYFLYVCSNEQCRRLVNLTNATKKCPYCRSELKKYCLNINCHSRYLNNIKDKDIFGNESAYSLSQMHCIECNNYYNIYKNFIIYFLKKNLIYQNQVIELDSIYEEINFCDIIILKINFNSSFLYFFIKTEALNKDYKLVLEIYNYTFKINNNLCKPFTDIKDLVKEIFL